MKKTQVPSASITHCDVKVSIWLRRCVLFVFLVIMNVVQ